MPSFQSFSSFSNLPQVDDDEEVALAHPHGSPPPPRRLDPSCGAKPALRNAVVGFVAAALLFVALRSSFSAAGEGTALTLRGLLSRLNDTIADLKAVELLSIRPQEALSAQTPLRLRLANPNDVALSQVLRAQRSTQRLFARVLWVVGATSEEDFVAQALLQGLGAVVQESDAAPAFYQFRSGRERCAVAFVAGIKDLAQIQVLAAANLTRASILALNPDFPSHLFDIDNTVFDFDEFLRDPSNRLLVETPSTISLPDVPLSLTARGVSSGLTQSVAQLCEVRGVVTSDLWAISYGVGALDVLSFHGSMYVDTGLSPAATKDLVDAGAAPVVLSRVAGNDKATFGLHNPSLKPLVVMSRDRRVTFVLASLSNARKGRYQPVLKWTGLINALVGAHLAIPALTIPPWTPTVAPSFDRSTVLSPLDEQRAMMRGVNYLSRMLPQDKGSFHVGPHRCPMAKAAPAGYVPVCMTEGWAGSILRDGSQIQACHTRTDTNGEGALTLALASTLEGTVAQRRREELRDFAGRMMQYQVLYVDMQAGNDSCAWGFVKGLFVLCNAPAPGFGADASTGQVAVLNDPLDTSANVYAAASRVRPFPEEVFYGDDNSRWAFGMMGTGIILNDPIGVMAGVQNAFAVLRATGVDGFRYMCLNPLSGGASCPADSTWWHNTFNSTMRVTVDSMASGHYLFTVWGMFYLMYNMTGIEVFNQRANAGLETWTQLWPSVMVTVSQMCDTMQMVWPLAWRVRVNPSAANVAQLKRFVTTIWERRHESGLVPDSNSPGPRWNSGAMAGGNDEYNTRETMVISKEGEGVSDLLYGYNWFYVGVHEAWAATGDEFYAHIADAMTDALVRVQAASHTHPELDGAWFRGFDADMWDIFGSPGDIGWNAFGVENSWTVTWITITMALRNTKSSLFALLSAAPALVSRQWVHDVCVGMFKTLGDAQAATLCAMR
jgi:hypothetical protein